MTRIWLPLAAAVALLAGACGARREPEVSKPAVMSPEMVHVVRERTRTDHRGLEIVRHPDGRASMKLERRFRSVPVGYLDAEGRVQVKSGSIEEPRE